MTERELFQSWLKRENESFTVDDEGDIVILDTNTSTLVCFREDGTFEFISSSD